MNRYSMSAALGEAFGLMRRRPLAVFVWGLLVLGPALIGLTLILPAMAAMFASLPADPETAEAGFSEMMMAEMIRFQLASMLMNLGQLIGVVIAYTAIMRAVLRPDERSYFSLRVGMDELRVAVVGLAIGIVMYAALIGAMLLGAALVATLWGLGEGLAISVGVVLGLAALAAVFWGLARASLIAPASVLYRDFAFSQGWKLATNKGWPLFGMMIVILLIILAIELALVLVGVLAAGAAFSTWSPVWVETSSPIVFVEAWMAANWWWMAVVALFAVLVYGCLVTLTVAPFASACRQLAVGDASSPTGAAASPTAAA